MENNEQFKVMPEVGKLVLAGFDEKHFTPDGQAAELIRDYNVQAFEIRPCNFESVPQLKQLIKDMQAYAFSLNHERPLIIATGMRSYEYICSEDSMELTKLPHLLALVAADQPSVFYEASKSCALELRQIGFNLVLGPLLDIFSKATTDYVGLNCPGITSEEVTRYGGAMAAGFTKSGILTSASYFPGIGRAFFSDVLETITMLEDMGQIENYNCLPFKALIDHNMLDSIRASVVCIPNALEDDVNACLSPIIINGLLRQKFKFDKLVITEDIEVQDIFTNYGIGQAASLAIVNAGCDMVTVCNSFKYQLEVLDFLNKSFANGNHQAVLITALRRIDEFHGKISWYDAKVELDLDLMRRNRRLAERSFRNSITLVRNLNDVIPVQKFFEQLKFDRLYQSSETQENRICLLYPVNTRDYQLLTSDFINIALENHCEIVNHFYSQEGLTPLIKELLNFSTLAIVFVKNLCSNVYQVDLLKDIGNYLRKAGKHMITISTESPFNLIRSETLAPTFINTYDDCYAALKYLPHIIFGQLEAKGCLPGSRKRAESRDEIVSGLSVDNSGGQFEFLLNKPVTSVKETILDQPWAVETNEVNHLINFDSVFHSSIENENFGNFGNPDGTYSDHDNEDQLRLEKNTPPANKIREKPWVVEEFEYDRDRCALSMLKTSMIEDLYFAVDNDLLSRTWEYKHRFKDDCKMFVVRNPSMGVVYGLVCVIVDKYEKCGRIGYLVVSRAKRRQSVGEILHQRAIKYITIERSCLVVALGSPFPFLNYFVPKVLNEISTLWEYLETKDKSKVSLAKSTIQLVGFYKSLGWSYTRHRKGIYQQQRKYIMHLTIDRWELPGMTGPISQAGISDGYSFIKSLKRLGVKFIVSDDSLPAFKVCYHNLKNGKTTDDEEKLFSTMYDKANTIIQEEIEDYQTRRKQRNTLVMYALIGDVIVGFCILYSSESIFSYFYPFIEKFKPHLEEKVAGITGLYVGLSVEDKEKMVTLNPGGILLIKLGLVTSAVQILRKMKVRQLILPNVTNENFKMYTSMGFTKFMEYCACFGKKGAFEWVV
ncbi:hypothetical protein CANINC_003504 [Pichia inconspicua]|uniref:Glycoside hydrolase family 3 N-terminal domain-containing protein n=1 Tax=Pichia inconspicua TaxID=52247 RepID=A0A4T0WYP7_9ASCO|nr:hypothetical protein CANINC_003504 [[Candida] inconspicua]